MASKVRKYNSVYVSKLRPNSTDSKKVLSKRYLFGKTSKEIVAMCNKELKTKFIYDGKIGAYVIYKAPADKSPYYYVLDIS